MLMVGRFALSLGPWRRLVPNELFQCHDEVIFDGVDISYKREMSTSDQLVQNLSFFVVSGVSAALLIALPAEIQPGIVCSQGNDHDVSCNFLLVTASKRASGETKAILYVEIAGFNGLYRELLFGHGFLLVIKIFFEKVIEKRILLTKDNL